MRIALRLRIASAAALTLIALGATATVLGRSKPSAHRNYRYAQVQYACGFAGGPAFTIDFTIKDINGCEELEPPYLSIWVFDELPASGPKDYSLEPIPSLEPVPSIDSLLRASRCPAKGACDEAVSGTVHLTDVHGNKRFSGSYELHFKDGTVEKANFEARFQSCKSKPLLCM